MMKVLQKIGLVLLIVGLSLFTGLSFVGDYTISSAEIKSWVAEKGIKSEFFIDALNANVVGRTYSNPFGLSSEIVDYAKVSHEYHVQQIRSWELSDIHQDKINQDRQDRVQTALVRDENERVLQEIVKNYETVIVGVEYEIHVVGCLGGGT